MAQHKVDTRDASKIAELALSLQNFSYLLGSLMTLDGRLDVERLQGALFALHRNAEDISERLMEINHHCAECTIAVPCATCHRPDASHGTAEFATPQRCGALAGPDAGQASGATSPSPRR